MELEKEAEGDHPVMADKTLDENRPRIRGASRPSAFTIRDQQLNERGAKEARQRPTKIAWTC